MIRVLVPTALLLIPMPALAHSGHDTGAPFLAGLAHPLSGADHMLAMLAVGLWAALLGGRAVPGLPLGFLAGLLGGGLAAAAGLALPGVEPMIIASVIALGGASALLLRLPLPTAMVAVAVAGVFHGHAHGAEGPGDGLPAYAAGVVLTSGLLHLAGLGLGQALRHWSMAMRGAGTATAVAGLALALAG